jgi:nucleoside-diphosphate-sugar epimerase
MRLLVTGHHGYIGSVMTALLAQAGHDVVGLDSDLFAGCTFGNPLPEIKSIRKDVRDVEVDDLDGFEAVLHLAAVCNERLGDLNPRATYEINHLASVRLAEKSKEAGVERFLFSSCCRLYGEAGERPGENAAVAAVTPYARSKVLAERDISRLADASFSPTYLRNATAYGASPRLRADVVVNRLVGYAVTTGEVQIHSDGTPWRPLVHVRDIARAFMAVLNAPRDVVHDEAFNVGVSSENYQIREIAEMIELVVPNTRVSFAEGDGSDMRSHQVDCSKIRLVLPDFEPQWIVADGMQELFQTYVDNGLTFEQFTGSSYLRIKRVQELQAAGRLDDQLRWAAPVQANS